MWRSGRPVQGLIWQLVWHALRLWGRSARWRNHQLLQGLLRSGLPYDQGAPCKGCTSPGAWMLWWDWCWLLLLLLLLLTRIDSSRARG